MDFKCVGDGGLLILDGDGDYIVFVSCSWWVCVKVWFVVLMEVV